MIGARFRGSRDRNGYGILCGQGGTTPTEASTRTKEAAAAAEKTKKKSSKSSSKSSAGGDSGSLSVAQQNAVRSAESYLSFTAFSRSGLIGQLEFEGYSTHDATAAVDSLDIDYDEQAAKAAKNYLDLMGFSRSGLIDQLVFEGYTREQATYGVDQTGL